MRYTLLRYARSQGGFTLVELLVASAIGVIVMSGLTSVLLTSWRAGTIATSRVEASSQIRNFEFNAYDDFAHANMSAASPCTQPAPCTTQPIVLTGTHVDNSGQVVAGYTITYTWDGVRFLDRQVTTTGPAVHAATNVTAFYWYEVGPTLHKTVVITLTVTMQPNTQMAYAETQTMRFYPRVSP